MNRPPEARPWYTRIGPGLITACVVIGPGSILSSSKVGANNEYSMLWVVVLSVIFMLTYMTLGAKLGVVNPKSTGDLLREKAGSWLSILVGCTVFFISAAYQSGNNIGVAAAFEAFLDKDDPNFSIIVVGLMVAFNVVAISFLFAFKNLYKALEKLMMGFVGLMLVSFAINLIQLQPDPVDMARGFVPSAGQIDIELLALMGTTFVISAAYYQTYLVHQKGWGEAELRSGLIDARVGSVIMALLTIMLMSTAAAELYDGGKTVELNSPVEVANALKPTFGTTGKVIFCLGLFSAAYSSFIVNSMIGGFILSDGLGLGSKPDDLWPKLFTTLALLSGLAVGIAVVAYKFDRTPTIIAAQAVTVIGAPLVAGVLFWLTSREDIMGKHCSGPVTRVLAGLGLLLLIAMSLSTAFDKLPEKIQEYRKKSQATAPVSLDSRHFASQDMLC